MIIQQVVQGEDSDQVHTPFTLRGIVVYHVHYTHVVTENDQSCVFEFKIPG